MKNVSKEIASLADNMNIDLCSKKNKERKDKTYMLRFCP